MHLRWLAAVVVLALGWLAPKLGDPYVGAIEGFAARFAKSKALTVCAVALAAILTRVALLTVSPVPVPRIHDEFSYLLAGDTFAHARLTNPPHPMWIFFDTFHVLQHPSYQSVYPPAQGAILALGILLGHAWIGVVLSMAAMCGAMTWMLQGWLPAEWAFLGGVLVILRLHIYSYWTDSYWGGAAAAIGGALVMGALPRIVHRLRYHDAVIMGLGASLLANSRPLEGFLFCFPAAVALVIWLMSPRSPALTITSTRVLVPVACVLSLTAVFIGYYNWRVTGNLALFPHALDQQEYQAVPPFVWQPLLPDHHYSNSQFEHFYQDDIREHFVGSWHALPKKVWDTCKVWWGFFLGSGLSLPLVTLPWVLRDRRMRLPTLQFVLCALGLLAVSWFKPHYAAPLAATLFILLVQAIRHLRRWEIKGRPVGIFLTRLVVIVLLARIGTLTAKAIREPKSDWASQRVHIAAQLQSLPGEHLVIVCYTPGHDVHHEWVWNAADIDQAKVVWAREIPGQDLQPLLNYFKKRRVWVLDADTVPAKIQAVSGIDVPDAAPGTTPCNVHVLSSLQAMLHCRCDL